MATITATTTLDAPPDTVWAVFTDPNRFEDWLTIHQKWKGTVPDTFTQGGTMSQVVSMLGMPNTIEWVVDEVVHNERLVISGTGMAAVKAVFALTVAPTADGGTEATIDASFEGSLVKGALEKAIVRESRNQLDESMTRLNAVLAEQPA